MRTQTQKLDLMEITPALDRAWASRQKVDGTVAKLLYSAWTVYQGKRGRPKKGATTFSGYLIERKIPPSTAKDLIARHRVALGEIDPPKAKPESASLIKELDGPGQLGEAEDDETQDDSPIAEISVEDRENFALWRNAYDRTGNMDDSEADEWWAEQYLTVEHRRG
jgi:hypothetical protein